MAGIDDDVPPLEDMSEVLEQVHKLQGSQKTSSTGSALHTNTTQQVRSQEQVHKLQGSQKTSTGSAPQTNTTQQVRNQSAQASNTSETQQNGKNESNCPSSSAKKTTNTGATPKPKPSSSSGNFGGMKKGFLFGGSSSKPKTAKKASSSKPSSNTSAADIPLIKPKVPKSQVKKQHEIAEVQEAMKANTPLLQNTDWVTDDLMKKLDQHPRLLRQLSDPRITQAMTKFQRNPQLAMQEYQNNPEIQQFFKDFCGILGTHFESLAENTTGNPSTVHTAPSHTIRTQNNARGADISVHSSTNPNQATAADEAKMRKILSDPEIKEILQDEKIQKLFTELRSNPQGAMRLLAQLDLKGRDKVQRLVDAGLLGFQR